MKLGILDTLTKTRRRKTEGASRKVNVSSAPRGVVANHKVARGFCGCAESSRACRTSGTCLKTERKVPKVWNNFLQVKVPKIEILE